MFHLLKGLWIGAFIFPFADAANRERCVQKWSARLLAILRIKVEYGARVGAELVQRALIVANHALSWLGYLRHQLSAPVSVLLRRQISATGQKRIGLANCEKGGTIFIARGKQREVRRVYARLG